MTAPILHIYNLSKHYGKLRALNGVSFEVHPGEIVGLLGHNGAGKSTLIKCLMGSIQSYTGGIFINGSDILREHRSIRDHTGFLLEPSFCDYLSAKDNLELLNSVASRPDKRRVQEVLEIVSLKKYADKKVGDFSFGMRQRLGLAQVLLTRPQLIVLDEPTVGLDPLGVEIIKNIIVECSRNNVAVLFSSHQINDVLDICHRTIVMNEGSIVYDGPAAELNKKYYLVHLGSDAHEHADALQTLDPQLTVTSNVVRFCRADAIEPVLDYLLRHRLPIADLNCDTSMDELKKLMQQ